MSLTSGANTNGETRGPAQYAAFCGMCLIWGTTFLVIRVGNEAVAPVWAATLRLVIAAALSGAVALATGSQWPRGEALRGIAVFGFLNLGVNFVLLYWESRLCQAASRRFSRPVRSPQRSSRGCSASTISSAGRCSRRSRLLLACR